jgi:hypothetical protein
MTMDDVKAQLFVHCPTARIVATHGARAALRRQRLLVGKKDSDLPAARPVKLRIVDGVGREVGEVHAQFTPEGSLVYKLNLFEEKREER